MRTDIQMLGDADRLTNIRVMQVERGPGGDPFDVLYFEAESGTLATFLPLGWHELMQEAIRRAYPPEPICPVCYSIHIAGTACETHESYTHDPRLESPVS